MRKLLERIAKTAPVGPRAWAGLWLVAIVLAAFSVSTLIAEAGRYPGKGDLDVFLRAGWAVREGQDLYRVADRRGFHYQYPPLFATLMVPLADPPPTATPAQRAFILPYWASATIFYGLSLACLIWSLHLIAAALEAISAQGPPPRGSHIWWAQRVWPLIPTAIWFGDGAGRGQSTPFILLLVAGAAVAMLRGRRLTAGALVGFVGVLKLFPLYLLIFPLLRLDRRMILGAVAGVLAGLLLPVAIMGPTASVHAYHEFLDSRMRGEINGQGDPALGHEMHGTNSSIQSFEYMAYNTLHPDAATRAPTPPTAYFITGLAISAVLTLGVIAMMWRRSDALGEFLYFSALAVLMAPILPVSRPHYFLPEVLAFAGLFAAEWPNRKGLWPGWPLAALGLATLVIGVLVAVGQRQVIDFGLTTYAALALVAMAMVVARRRSPSAAHAAPKNNR